MKTLTLLTVVSLTTLSAVADAQTTKPATSNTTAAIFAALTKQEHVAFDATFSEGNTLSMVAIGSRPALYARTMYGEALKSNANEQMRSRAQGHEVALAKAATATAQANAQAACCQAATARIVVLAGYSRCGTRSCGCHRRVPVYRSYCSIRRAYRYRSYCYRTHAWNYNSYSYPGSMIWDTGFGPR